MSNNKEKSQRPQLHPEVVQDATTQTATIIVEVEQVETTTYVNREAVPTPVARPIVEVVAEIQTPAFADGERETRGNVPTPVARPIVEVVAEIQTPAFADGERKTRSNVPTPVARPIVEVVAEIQTPAFADGEPQEQMEEEEAEVLVAGSKK